MSHSPSFPLPNADSMHNPNVSYILADGKNNLRVPYLYCGVCTATDSWFTDPDEFSKNHLHLIPEGGSLKNVGRQYPWTDPEF